MHLCGYGGKTFSLQQELLPQEEHTNGDTKILSSVWQAAGQWGEVVSVHLSADPESLGSCARGLDGTGTWVSGFCNVASSSASSAQEADMDLSERCSVEPRSRSRFGIKLRGGQFENHSLPSTSTAVIAAMAPSWRALCPSLSCTHLASGEGPRPSD